MHALGAEICEPAKGHLDQYLGPLIIETAERDNWPAIVGNIRGLDGLDKEGITYKSMDDPEVQKLYASYRTGAEGP